MPPSKEAKPCGPPAEESAADQKAGVKKKTGPPPTPPNKPSSSGSSSNLTEVLPSNSHPPPPPSKEKKPSKEIDLQVQGAADETKEKEEDSGNETTEAAVETEEADELNLEDGVEDDKLESIPSDVSDEETPESSKMSDRDHQKPSEPQRRSPSSGNSKNHSEKQAPPARQKKEDTSSVTQPGEDLNSSACDTAPLQAPEAHPQSTVPSVLVSCNQPLTDSLSLLCHLSEEKKKKKAEEKSVDSGQHSDDESEGSGYEDMMAASTSALRGSNVALDVLDACDNDAAISINLRPSAELQIRPSAFPCRRSQPIQKPPKPLNKPRSASISNLLSESSNCTQAKQCCRAAAKNAPALKDDVTKLETEVALQMEKTSELLSKAQGGSCGGDVPEDLLAKALEKLKKAEHVLKEVKKLNRTKNSNNRKSW